jgi:hypothetical protein
MSVRMPGRRVAALVLACSLAALPVPATAADLVTVSIGGGLPLLAREWTARTFFTSWAGWTDTVERAELQAGHRAGGGSSFGATVGFRVSRRFGLSFAGARSRRDTTADITLTLPHPFFSGQPRSAAGQVSNLLYRETAFHFDLEWRPVLGRFELAVFAGPSLVKLETDAIDSAQAQDEYPYDVPSFHSAHSFPAQTEAAAGWNAGASGTWLASRHLDLSLTGRYAAATVDLRPAGVEPLQLDTGGLTLTAELRLRF